MQSDILLNLDSEDDGELYIGCAGGKDTIATLLYSKEEIPKSFASFKLTVRGLLGGHSGDDIQKGRGNANKILNRMLWKGAKEYGLRINDFDGGNFRNAIAREAFAVFCLPENNIDGFTNFLMNLKKKLKLNIK